MEAITSILLPTFNKEAIDSDFDIFQIKTEQRYFPKGARLLDLQHEGIKFKSIVFENGRSVYALCSKGNVTQFDLGKAISDGTVTIKKTTTSDIDGRILLKLFLYSLNCPSSEGASFNNLAGKFYVYVDGLNSSGKVLRVLSFDVGKDLGLLVSATSFTPSSLFPKDKIKDDAKYAFSKTHLSFRRVYGPADGETLYVRKTRFGKKTEVPFLKFNKPEQAGTKAFWIYRVLGWLKEEYSPYLSVDLKRAPIVKKVSTRRDAGFVEAAINGLLKYPCRVVNLIGEEYEEKALTLKKVLEEALSTSAVYSTELDRESINFCLIHNEDYYEEFHEQDPQKAFPSDVVVQCVAVEDGFVKVVKKKSAVIETIIKEAAIKNDIIHIGSVSLDSWASFGFSGDWTFMTSNNGSYYAMTIRPDGTFAFRKAKEGFIVFNDRQLNSLASNLSDPTDLAKTVVKDSEGNIILITGTSIFTVPDGEIFNASISRSKESRDRYLAGVVDINLFNLDGETHYNSGMIGSGMNTDVSKAAPLYKTTVVSGKNVIEDLLETMSVMFVKYKSFTVLPYPFKYLREYLELN